MRRMNKMNIQQKEILKIQENYNVEKQIDEVYYELESKMPMNITLYKVSSGEIYDVNEWTNDDLKIKKFLLVLKKKYGKNY